MQKPDGGWALATLGDWKRGDDLQQDTDHSDGYGTGFVLYALRRADVSPSDDVLRNGVKWLKSNQRESGRWYTRSLFKDNHHFISQRRHSDGRAGVKELRRAQGWPQRLDAVDLFNGEPQAQAKRQ